MLTTHALVIENDALMLIEIIFLQIQFKFADCAVFSFHY